MKNRNGANYGNCTRFDSVAGSHPSIRRNSHVVDDVGIGPTLTACRAIVQTTTLDIHGPRCRNRTDIRRVTASRPRPLDETGMVHQSGFEPESLVWRTKVLPLTLLMRVADIAGNDPASPP